MPSMAATLSLALGFCKEIQEKYSLILVESKNSPLIHRNQCRILSRKLSDTQETLVAVQHKLSDGEFSSSQSSVVWTPVIHELIHVLKRVHEIFFKDCFCKDKWLEAALRQGGDLKETFGEIVSDLQWYRSVLHSIVFKQVRQDSKDLAPVDCKRNLSKIDLEALSTAAKWDQEDLKGFLREFNGDPARHGENGNYISMQCLATQLLNKLEFQPWSSTAKEKHDESLHEDSRNKWSEGPLVLLVNMQDVHKGALLGEGSFGSVHETNWLGETYAMKSHKPGLKDCLKAEIKALAGLQHPHVIRLVGCAEEEGKCLYLMERMDKSLSKMLEDCSLSLVQRVDMMLQIAEGVRYLHSKNLVHRDLKPENILVKHDDSGPESLMLAPLVEDFWIAKVSDFDTVKEKMESMAYEGQTMNIGTTMFMAPEMYQLEDSAKWPERFHPMKTDVYSFALICFVVLTSESTPFPFEELRNPSVRDFKDRVRKGKRPKLPADCPVYLSHLIQQCWDGNPVKRPNFDDICTKLRQIKDFLLTGPLGPKVDVVLNCPCYPFFGIPSMAATLSLALDLCKEIQEKYSLILVESKNSPLIHRNQCMILYRKLSDTRETLVAVQHKLSDSEFTSSQSSVVGTPVIHELIHVLKRVHSIFFKDCFCKDKWLEAALRQGGDLKETFVEIVSDLQWYRSVLHSIVFKQVGQDSKDLAPVDCNRNLSKIDLEALSTAAKWDQEDLRGFLREFNGDPARHGENGNYISMQCLATQLLNKLEFQPWSSTAKEKHDKWSEGPLVLLVNMQDVHKGALLGEGSFGSVHEANWLGETYAMKSHKPGFKKCLKAEIKALAGLQHPHVIRLVGCAEEKGKCLYLMERMDKSLSKMLEDCSLSLVQRVDMMLQIAEGVRYLHSNNLAHRDLKPEHILVKHDDSGPESLMLAPLVEDFWIAKVSDFDTVKEKMESMAYVGQTMNIGTTMFMAPEMYQLEDSAKWPERFHPMKTDVYSFALICYVVLTSESTPFPFEELRNPTVRDFKDRVRKGKRPKLPADCPVYLSHLIQQCWDGNPVKRPNFDDICTKLRQIKDFLLTGAGKEEVSEMDVTMPHSPLLKVEEILASEIRMSEGVRHAVKEVESFKHECLELDRKVDTLASLLKQAACFSITNPAGLYESPTRQIAMEVEKTLERALILVKKCRWSGMLQRVITNTCVSDFQKVNLYLDNSIANVQYLLNISASGEDRPIHMGLPPIAFYEPVLSIVWENVSIVHVGNAEEKAQGASCLADLAKDTRNRSIICMAGGVPPLQCLLREGTPAGQEEAARALGYLTADRNPLDHSHNFGVKLAATNQTSPHKHQHLISFVVCQ